MTPFKTTTRLSLLLAGTLLLAGVACAQEEPSEAPPPSYSLEVDSLDTVPPEAAPLKAKAVVVDIVSDTLEYDPKNNLYTAIGQVKVVVSEQNTDLIADEVVYDPKKELMVAKGNVIITNKGQKTYGTYAKIDLTRKSALINDPVTSLDEIRVKARQAFVADEYLELEDGKLVVPATKPKKKNYFTYDAAKHGEGDLSQLATMDPLIEEDQEYKNKLMAQQLDMSWDEEQGNWRDKFRLHAKEVQVRQTRDGYDDINLTHPKLKFGNFTLASMHQMDFSHDGTTGDIEYLGPDIGIDPDYGGMYFGPGWDFRLGDGVLKFSPLASLGTGNRRTRGGRDLEQKSGLGYGALVQYMSHDFKARAAYNSVAGQPILYARKKLGSGKSNLILSANEDYQQGYLGWERPKYIAQLTDNRKLYQNDWVRVSSFGSVGFARDEFFPTNDEDFFVQPDDPDAKPVSAGRLQLQAEIRNTKPLLHIGGDKYYADFGMATQFALSAYTTADMVGLVRGGPNVRLRLGDKFSSYTRYYYANFAGDTPFVFDTYYRGRNSVMSINQFRVNDYLTVGMRSHLSLGRDNSQDALFTGNQVFMLVGPKDIKLNIAYDFIRQRSFFGISYLPGNNRKTIHYDKMKIYQPVNYTGPATQMLEDPDVGMMNGNKAR